MGRITHWAVFLCCLAYSSAENQQETTTTTTTITPKDDSSRLLTEVGYLRYGDPFYIYPSIQNRRPQQPSNPTDTNQIENQDEGSKRPLFIFTTFEDPLNPQQLSNQGPYIEIRKKRDVEAANPDSTKVGILRRKRSYCHRCGGGGHGGYGGYGGYGGGYVPVSYAVYPVYTSYVPVYYGGGGGGGRGCHTCGGGGGGGLSGSYSYSSSSSKSSSGSWGWGK